MGATRVAGRSKVELAATAVGATFLLVGILGFIPGITTDLDQLKIAGHESDAKLLGLFQVSVLHNVVHLLFGVVGLIAGRSIAAAKGFLVGGGALYLGLWLYGLLIGEDSAANFIPVNPADDWLHFGLGAAMIGLGIVTGSRADTRGRALG